MDAETSCHALLAHRYNLGARVTDIEQHDIDDAFHAAVVPIGSRIRIAGTAEFDGDNLRIRRDGIENLL